MRPPSDEQLTMGAAFLFAHLPQLVLHARPDAAQVDAFTRSKLSAGSSAASLGGIMIPALLKAMSSRAKLATARSTRSATCASSETSQVTPRALWPTVVRSSV